MVGYENDQCDMGQTDAGMKNEMFREEEMDDDDESPSERQIVVGICAMTKKIQIQAHDSDLGAPL